jgi:hypothetical protein
VADLVLRNGHLVHGTPRYAKRPVLLTDKHPIEVVPTGADCIVLNFLRTAIQSIHWIGGWLYVCWGLA